MDNQEDCLQLPPAQDDGDDHMEDNGDVGARRYTRADLLEVGLRRNLVGAVTAGGADGPATLEMITEVLKTVEARTGCPICLGDGDEADAWTETPCRHSFHRSCVERWLEAKGSCPMCRRQLLTLPPAAVDAHRIWEDLLELYGEEELINAGFSSE